MIDSTYRGLLFGLLGVSLLFAACSGGTIRTQQDDKIDDEVIDEIPPLFGLSERAPLNGLTFPLDIPEGNPSLELVRAFPALSFSQPVFLTAPPDSSDRRIFVVEKTGSIRVFDNSPSTSTSTLFLNVAANVDSFTTSGEQGLLGLAFDPNYSSNRYFYVYYSFYNASANPPRRSIVSRFRTMSGNPNAADPNSEVTLLDIRQPDGRTNHKSGMIAFSPIDDMLYIGLGDGGGGGDPEGSGQNKNTLLGAILRIDPNRDAVPSPAYTVPAGNPFLGESGSQNCGPVDDFSTPESGSCREIWAYGLRNPWRFSFDSTQGDLWVADVGQGAWEEIDLVSKGDNLGWNVCEGNHGYGGGNCSALANHVPPIYEYGRGTGNSITGGYVYRGSAASDLAGLYLFGDYGSEKVWSLNYNPLDSTTTVNEIGTLGGLVSFGEDGDKELYLVSIFGTLWTFEEQPPAEEPPTPPDFPDTLSATGLFSNTASLEPNPGLIEYDLNSPLWSDNAIKRRWIGVPDNSTIDFSAEETWTFPIGSVLVKHFELEINPTTVRRLETRVLIRHNQGWRGYTYLWNDAQTEADLLTNSLQVTYAVEDPEAPGGTRDQVWSYPSRNECLRCHTSAGGRVIGPRTKQLHRDFPYSEGSDNQLRALNHIRLFSKDIGDHDQYEAFPNPQDGNFSIELRAKAYLQTNCANCHLPNGPTPVDMDLRYETPLGEMGIVGIASHHSGVLVMPGNKEESVIWQKMNSTDPDLRMPPLGTHLTDAMGLSIIGDWIESQ